MSLLWRNWIAFVAVLATVLSVLGFLAVLQHDVILARLIQERLTVIAETTASSFRSVVNLGLPISTVRNARDVLARAREIDPDVTAIQVFNPTGIVVHTTHESRGRQLSRQLLQVQSLSKSDRWSAPNDTEMQAGFTIRNAAGEAVGGVLVSASNQDFEARSKAMTLRIAIDSAVVFAIAALISFLILRVKLGGAMRGLAKLHSLSQRFASGGPTGRPAGPEDPPGQLRFGFMSAEIVRLETLLQEAHRRFQDARSQLGALGGKVEPDGATDAKPEALESVETGRTASGPVTSVASNGKKDFDGVAVASVPETSFARVFARHLTPWAVALVLGSALLLGYLIQQDVTRSFEPELAARTKLIGNIANRNVQRAVSAGVPLEQLVGAEHYFGDLLRNFPEISYFGVATGRIIYEAGTRQKSVFAPERSRKDVPTFPILASDGTQIGYIIVDANPAFFALQFRDLLLDFGVVVLVVILLAFQVIVVVMSRSLTAPFVRLQHLAALQAEGDFSKIIAAKSWSAGGVRAIDQLSRLLSRQAVQLHLALESASQAIGRSGNAGAAALERIRKSFHLHGSRPRFLQFSYLNDVRLPLFLFAAADELPLAFFPIFTRAAENPLTWLDPGVVISLPLAGYLVAIVLGSPFARPLAQRFGHRNLLLCAALPTLLAHLGLYFSSNVVEIVCFRTVTGFGYALATLACQDYVLDVVPANQRNRSLGLFTAAWYSGIFAGTAMGGVLADRLGQSEVFAVSALLVLVSGIMAFRLMPARATASPAPHPEGIRKQLSSIWPSIRQPLRSRRFAALVFGIAIPSNVLLQAFISFLVALQLDHLGASTADTGRILMTYFLAIVFVGPLAPQLFEHRLSPSAAAVTGALIAGLCLCAVAVWPSPWTMLVAVAGAGIGHGMVRDPQVVVAMEIAENELEDLGPNVVLGALRTLERGVSIVGLIVMAALASLAGFGHAIAVIAALSLLGAALFAFVSFGRFFSSRSRRTGGN